MRIKVDLFAELRKYGDSQSSHINLPPGSTVRDILSLMGIPADIPVLAVVNEMMVSSDETLKDGDTIGLFPPMGGGECRGVLQYAPAEFGDRI